jgi:hypothetical protein
MTVRNPIPGIRQQADTLRRSAELLDVADVFRGDLTLEEMREIVSGLESHASWVIAHLKRRLAVLEFKAATVAEHAEQTRPVGGGAPGSDAIYIHLVKEKLS